MAVGAWKMYGAALEAIARNTIDLDSNTFRLVLVTSAYTPNQNTHSTWADASANEVANGNGYATHGKLLTCTIARTNLVVTWDSDDQSWTAASFSCKYALIVKDADANGALASTDAIIAYCDLETGGGSVTVTSGTLALTLTGLVTLTAS